MNRKDAGIRLGKILEPRFKDQDVLVLGIPRGGVEVAYHVAQILQAPLSVLITKKLPHPLQEELAIGAAAEDGSVFLTSLAHNWDSDTIKNIVNKQLDEIKSRIQRFRKGRPLPDMRGKTVIIVDDGIATGSTLVPAIKLCKAWKAAFVIVAAPVSGRRYVSEINSLADQVVIELQPSNLSAVGEVYNDFSNLEDIDVLKILDDYTKNSHRVLH
ncbi:MAG TPA: phosphoribosyltransferase family protein [Chryseosolibacter sp.]|nr:phosphoribosyltransferase family protein [Chryseosolibacter sp.]